MRVTFYILSLIFFSCSRNPGKTYRLTKLDERKIEFAEIKRNLYDTVSVPLNKQQLSKFAAIVDESPAEMRKAKPNYWIFVKLMNNSVIPYKVLDHYIGERDLYTETDEAAYFKKVYETSKKTKHVISLKNTN